MAQLTDFSSDAAKVRLLIADTDDTDQVMNDAAIAAFLSLAAGSNVFRAAALALRSIAVNEVLVQKRIKMLDLSTDGPGEAAALEKLAAQYEQRADQDEATEAAGAFDWAESVNTNAQYNELLYKDMLRS